ncbi:hypothetical protein I5E68_09960 [Novosphingobium sp. YJ-S2-02]|uniref:Uncharacterized protein n=1 Tax=Novosphingobium aureum TaxID=2792964 RepID=A0A931HC33_9SPHN|nr:hypothetical protein [Novosphingobium aureum]MBH0113270.1 hypothetical protein [Novosphingobium aureum]
MTRTKTPKAQAAKPATKTVDTVETDARVEPVFAIHKVTYGKGKTAMPTQIFVPATEGERDELLLLGAARDCDEGELLLAEKLGLLKPAEVKTEASNPPPASTPAASDDASQAPADTASDAASSPASDDDIT